MQGEPLTVVESMSFSASAYEAARIRLDRKYGGARRALTLRLEELEEFKPIREGSETDLVKFVELLDGNVVNLINAEQQAELGSGPLYISLQRKFNKNLLIKYQQWVRDNDKEESVKVLREFIERESEFLTTASETIIGIKKESARPKNKGTDSSMERTHFSNEKHLSRGEKPGRGCKVCGENHGVWACYTFKNMKEQWQGHMKEQWHGSISCVLDV